MDLLRLEASSVSEAGRCIVMLCHVRFAAHCTPPILVEKDAARTSQGQRSSPHSSTPFGMHAFLGT